MQFKIYTYLQAHPVQKKIVKYWVRMSLPFPSLIKRQIANEIHAEMIIRLMDTVVKENCLTLEQARKIHFEIGTELSPQISDILSVEPNDARSLSNIIDFLHDLLFISGKEVIKSTENKAISHWHHCSLSDRLANLGEGGGPYYCHLYQEMYKGVLYGINPKAKANNLSTTQSLGCEYCELETWIEQDS